MNVSAIERIAQGAAAESLQQAGSDPIKMQASVAAFTGASLTDAIHSAKTQLGDVDGPGVQNAPVGVNDTASATAGQPLVIAAATLLANDTDADGNALSITGVSGASHGSVSYDAATQKVTFTPDAGYTGAAAFTYAISDGNGGTGQASVNVTVTALQPPANSGPVGVNDSYSTNEDTALVISGPGVLANDTDADSNPLTASVVTGRVTAC